MKSLWTLDPTVTFLNHGSYGACPRDVLAAQQRWRDRLERQPVHFMARELEPAMDAALTALATFIGADAADLAFVSNATTGVNTVLRSLVLAPGDQLLTTNHIYNACKNALDAVAERHGAEVVVADVPFPLQSSEQVTAAIIDRVTPHTKLALIDHITSPTALIFPVKAIVEALSDRGVATLIDGAHAPGSVPLDITSLAATYYVGNCHKWLCGPKSAGFLWVDKAHQDQTVPLVVSHGRNSPRRDRSAFQLNFGWLGTVDPTPYLAVADTLTYMSGIMPGGWPEIMSRNHALAVSARAMLCERLSAPPLCPDHMLAAMACVTVDETSVPCSANPSAPDPLGEWLLAKHQIEVPIIPWTSPGSVDRRQRLVRISAHLHNDSGDYDRLAVALSDPSRPR